MNNKGLGKGLDVIYPEYSSHLNPNESKKKSSKSI